MKANVTERAPKALARMVYLALGGMAAALPCAWADVSNPETFESYSAGTTPGTPEGWDLTHANFLDKTVQSGGPTGNFLRLRATFTDPGNAYWLMPSTALGGISGSGPVLSVKADVRFSAVPTDGNFAMMGISTQTGADYHYHHLSFFYSNDVPILYANNDGSGGNLTSQTPPGSAGISAPGNWFTVEAELDYTANTVRERYGPQGGPMGAFTPTIPIGVLSENEFQEIRFGAVRGTIDIDNLSISVLGAEPGWKTDASGDWNISSNWNGGVPNGVDASAILGPVIQSPQTVYTNTPVMVGALKYDSPNTYQLSGNGSLTIQTSSGSGSVNILQGSQKINLPLFFASDASVSVAGGATLTIGNPMTIRAGKTVTKSGSVSIEAPLTLEAGATLVTAGGRTSLFGVPSLAAGAKIDIKNNSVTVDYRGLGSVGTAIKNQIAANGIMSSSAISGQTGIGWMDDAATQSVLVKYTYLGDTNLDGQVDVIDLGNLATAWQTAGVWVNGDSNYDNFIDVIDLGMLATNWQAGVGSPLGPGSLDEALAAYGLPSVSVPEPIATGLVMLIPLATQRRLRRRLHR